MVERETQELNEQKLSKVLLGYSEGGMQRERQVRNEIVQDVVVCIEKMQRHI